MSERPVKNKKSSTARKKVSFRDPMVLILAALLVFLTIGTAFFSSKEEPLGNGIRIELDAAYGGDAKGYEGIITESEFNENVVNALETILKADTRFTVVRTHEAGTDASVEEKGEKITKDNPELVLSIHCAGTADETVSGMNVYAETPSMSSYEKSLAFANEIVNCFFENGFQVNEGYLYYIPYGENAYQMEMVDVSDTTVRDQKTWALMEETEVPVVVVEQIYCSNQSDVDTYANEEGYQKIANTYYQAILNMYGLSNE